MKKGKILSAAVVVGMVSNLALSSATFAQDSQLEPGTCGMTINTEVHTWSNKAQATGPCEGLVEGYYLADNGEPWLIGGVTQPVDYSGQQFVIGTPNHPYGESILTVYIEPQPEEPTEPQDPVEEPEQPTEPQEPVEEPEEPTEPQEPVEEPEEPTEPQEPVEEPEEPTEPQEPVEEPEEPTEPQESVEEPEEPTEPQDPVEEPEQPTEPQEPVEESEQPTESQDPVEEPEQPTEPQESVEEADKTDLEQAGDGNAIVPENLNENNISNGDNKEVTHDELSAEVVDTNEGQEGNRLPNTATNVYNMMLLGATLLLAGGITLVWRRKNQEV